MPNLRSNAARVLHESRELSLAELPLQSGDCMSAQSYNWFRHSSIPVSRKSDVDRSRLLAIILAHTHTPFKRPFPGQLGLAGCPLDSQSPVILILSILTGQAETLYTDMVLLRGLVYGSSLLISLGVDIPLAFTNILYYRRQTTYQKFQRRVHRNNHYQTEQMRTR